MANFQQEVESKAQEERVGHPAGEYGCQCSSTSQCNRDGIRRPVAKADDERLADAHRHAASAHSAPPKA